MFAKDQYILWSWETVNWVRMSTAGVSAGTASWFVRGDKGQAGEISCCSVCSSLCPAVPRSPCGPHGSGTGLKRAGGFSVGSRLCSLLHSGTSREFCVALPRGGAIRGLYLALPHRRTPPQDRGQVNRNSKMHVTLQRLLWISA